MDLHEGNLTLGQLLANPGAAALLREIDPRLLHHPLAGLARHWTINQAAAFARQKGASPEQIRQVLTRLEQL